MNNFFYAGLVACTVFSLFAGCGKDDDNKNENPASEIVGVWKPSKLAVLSGKDDSVLQEIAVDDCTKQSSYEFTSDGKVKIKEYAENASSCQLMQDTTSDYTFSKDKMELKIGSDIIKLHSFTSNELSFPIDAGGEFDADQDGTPDIAVLYYVK